MLSKSTFLCHQVKNWWDVNSKEYEKKYNDHLEHDKKRLHAGVKREEMIQDEKEVLYDFLVTVKAAPHECLSRTGQPQT